MDFALELLRYSSEADETSLLSPFAVVSAMSVLYSGARGKTEREIGAAISAGQTKRTFENFMECTIKNIRNQLKRKNFTAHYSTKIYEEGNFLRSDFKDIANQQYAYDLAQIDFASFLQANGSEFNKWANREKNIGVGSTAHVISHYPVYLFNKLEFDAYWQYEFPPLNYLSSFHFAKSRKIDVAMMIRTAEFPYYEDRQMQIVSLPLKNSEMEMLIILPKEIFGLEDFEAELTGEKLFNYIDKLVVSGNVTVCCIFFL
ncbi:hypothetical protein LOAG_15412 [Loa loa]|uniref:Serpin domain-containing protein n=1 Tax=Loa loa TaxID=7209 RepID=A0A1S0TFV7_LOALO|nr:hypothetical protein LOAG_15412 [Loa loa]EFO13118.2 hypothetical protein LOAG_15412 [Loa loa]